MPKQFKSSFTFGGLVAESDHLLLDTYLDNGDYETIESHEDKRCFIIGRTGSGKSAAFKRLEKEHQNKVIRIDPESLSLAYISGNDTIRQLIDKGVHLEPLIKALWKHVILVEVIRHRYKTDDVEKKQNILNFLNEKLKRDPAKAKALEYINRYGDAFWCGTEERVKEVTDTFVGKINAIGEIGLNSAAINAKGSSSVENTKTQEIKKELVERYQKIVNEMQMPQLNYMLTTLNNTILDAPQHFTYLVIDDLDKEWIDEDLVILLIKCLFQAVVDLQKIQHLKILVALRTNIFNQLNYGKQIKGGQEEKFRGLALDLRWTSNDLKEVLDLRAKKACQLYQIVPIKGISEMLPGTKSKKAINPLTYIMDHTLMRPRDAILFLNNCVREAAGRDRITWNNIYNAEKKYSQERLLALRDEWKDPYIGIDKVFEVFQNQNARMSRKELTPLLEDIGLLLAEREFPGGDWLNEIAQYMFSGENDWNKIYRPIINFLYSISFLGIAKSQNAKFVYSYEEHGLSYILDYLQESTYFEIHSAFRTALHMKE